MNRQKTGRLNTQRLATIAMLAAVASLLFFLEIPVVLFYKLDFSNLPMLLGTFSMGPLAGSIILGIKSLLGLLHTSSQGVGELADFLMGLAMILPAGLIYRSHKNRRGALLGIVTIDDAWDAIEDDVQGDKTKTSVLKWVGIATGSLLFLALYTLVLLQIVGFTGR